jgi:hypothetical protein
VRAAVILLLLLQPVGSSNPAKASWKLDVRQYEVPLNAPPRPTLFWLGLTNASREPRAFCLYGVYYGYETAQGEVVFAPSESHPNMGAVHGCSSVAEAGNLVLPGETHFVKVRLPQLPDSVLQSGIEFSVSAEDACVTSQRCEFRGGDIQAKATWRLGAAEQ